TESLQRCFPSQLRAIPQIGIQASALLQERLFLPSRSAHSWREKHCGTVDCVPRHQTYRPTPHKRRCARCCARARPKPAFRLQLAPTAWQLLSRVATGSLPCSTGPERDCVPSPFPMIPLYAQLRLHCECLCDFPVVLHRVVCRQRHTPGNYIPNRDEPVCRRCKVSRFDQYREYLLTVLRPVPLPAVRCQLSSEARELL